MLNIILDSIRIVLEYDDANRGRTFIKNHQCATTIEELMNHKSSIIYNKSYRIFDMLQNENENENHLELNDDLDVLFEGNDIFDGQEDENDNQDDNNNEDFEENEKEEDEDENEDEDKDENEDEKDVVIFRESPNHNED
jgi:hypothetical protein